MASSRMNPSFEDVAQLRPRDQIASTSSAQLHDEHLPVGRVHGQHDLYGGHEQSVYNNVHSVSTTSAPRHMFGKNTAVFGGHFYQAENVIHNTNLQGIDPFMRLLVERVAHSAFHNSAQRIDPPRCHPHTRVQILESICDWVWEYPFNQRAWIVWLNGAAGAGKSAIMQTVAEQFLAFKFVIAIGSFFFSRGDSTRNTMTPLVATLVYQLMQEIPEIKDDILHVIERNPLIFDQALEFQFHELVIQPLRHLPPDLTHQFVVLIDGLDECLDQMHQRNLIRVIANLSSGTYIPVIFAIASRREPQILSEFGMPTIKPLLKIVPLDDSEASDDIRQYLNAEFTRIKKTHPFRHLLASDWPSVSIVSELVDKASGQFIFASVVVRYLSSPRANPGRQLQIIRDLRLRHPSSEHPFAHLDSLYRHIFSQVEFLDAVLDVLALQVITRPIYLTALEPLLGNLEVILADLAPVLRCARYVHGNIGISFLHASLPDFLQDQSRSQKYFLNLNKYHLKLLCMFLEQSVPDSLSPDYARDIVAMQEFMRIQAIHVLLEKATASDRLQCAVVKFKSSFHGIKMDESPRNAYCHCGILFRLKNLNFGDQGQAYKHVLNMFAEGHAKFWDSHTEDIKASVRCSSDLCSRICQLRPELEGDPSLDPYPDLWCGPFLSMANAHPFTA